MRRVYRSIAVASFLVLSLTGCGISSQSSDAGGGSDISMSEPGIVVDESGKTTVTPAIIRNGDLTLETSNVEQVFSDVQSAVAKFDARIESSNFQGRVDGYGPNAYLSVRVPESKLDSLVDELSKLGKRTSFSTSTSDVTLQSVDLQAKIDSLEESRVRLQLLIDKATTTAELIAGEQALATLRTELDSYQSQLDYLKNQVAESTLNVQIVDDNSSVTSGWRGFKEIFLQAARGFVNAFQSAFVFIITAIPWLLLVGLTALLGRLISKSITRISGRKDRTE